MRILLVNRALDYYAGTETFTYALACELARRGHDVTCFSPRLGSVAQRLDEQGIRSVNDLAKMPDSVDVIHAHHRDASLLAFARYPNTPMVLVCHGVLPGQEQPLQSRLNIHRYVAVSEEVRDHLVGNYGIAEHDVVVIRNGVDLTRFRSFAPVAPRAQRALLLSNNMPPAQRAFVRRTCAHLGLQLREVGAGRLIWKVEDEINKADIVFGLGRSALEGMACKRVVVVYDYGGGDGLVTPDRFVVLRERNFSGRTYKRHYTERELAEEIAAYSPTIPEMIYDMIVRDHDVRQVAGQFIALYEEACHEAKGTTHPRRDVAVEQYAAMRELLAEIRRHRLQLEAIYHSRGWRFVESVSRAMAVFKRKGREMPGG